MFPLIRGWTSVVRSSQANVRLGAVLSFVAGAANAGGFLAVGRYTSHMTGVVSSVADDIVLGQFALVAVGLGSLCAFLMGAMWTAILVNWGLRKQLRSAYSLPLVVESVALLVFGLFGAAISGFASLFLPLTVLLLCFMMGLQNAVITKISHAEIRTTHVTGLVTDLGIELGKWLYVNRLKGPSDVRANRQRLRLQALLIACFFVGGLSGAWGFKAWGYITTLPLAVLLWTLAMRPVLDDIRQWWEATA
ncbi:hypothetical protein B9Z39_11815 [Limnohabitans sp. JirII-29]|uniref:YoaK family protein n=1 Tax=unclassified Limnohabitans TaxID=2626134 RepID=UPI000C1F36E7|nr:MULTISPECIES: YoaK family protein [unclassified Limnohabitans]PIT79161.1 hypothetical protein B9Z41_07030 [Limnohabitans sp. JirII-31]PUE25296.1 hypothetical protein B9Z39_11815 [Limnohabitans sp. JirII-29]